MGVHYSVSPLPGRIFSFIVTWELWPGLVHLRWEQLTGGTFPHSKERAAWSGGQVLPGAWGSELGILLAFQLLFRSSSCFPIKGQFAYTEDTGLPQSIDSPVPTLAELKMAIFMRPTQHCLSGSRSTHSTPGHLIILFITSYMLYVRNSTISQPGS